jgi:hypothetical protein
MIIAGAIVSLPMDIDSPRNHRIRIAAALKKPGAISKGKFSVLWIF